MFLRGNHDYWLGKNRYKKAVAKADGKIVEVVDYKEIKHEGSVIVLSHYPFRSWNKSFHGSIHFHGHCHGNVVEDESVQQKLRRVDMGVDCWSFSPTPLELAIDIAEHRGTTNDV